jgi:hypothetical protein
MSRIVESPVLDESLDHRSRSVSARNSKVLDQGLDVARTLERVHLTHPSDAERMNTSKPSGKVMPCVPNVGRYLLCVPFELQVSNANCSHPMALPGERDSVGQLAKKLDARRLASSPNVVTLDTGKRGARYWASVAALRRFGMGTVVRSVLH